MKQQDLFNPNQNHIEELSISKCLVFRRCPFEYRFRYIEKRTIKWDPKANMGLGSFLHELIADYFKKKIINKEKELIYALFNAKWEIERPRFGNYHEDYYKKCRNAIELFLDNPISKIYPIATEYKFGKLVNKDLYFTGRVDLIGKLDIGNIQIWEFKLEESEILSFEQEYKRYFQLVFYYYGIGDSFGAFPQNLGYYFFNSGKSISISVTPEILDKGFREVVNMLNEIKNAREFIPKINECCPSCGFNNICPSYKILKGEGD